MKLDPIHAQASEEHLLSCLLVWPETLPEICAIIEASDLYAERNRLVFQAVRQLAKDGKPVDFVTVISQLTTDGTIRQAGHADYIADLVDKATTSANAGYHAKVVKSKATARKLRDNLLQLAERCADTDDTDALMADAYQTIEQAGSTATTVKGILTLQDMAEMYAKQLAAGSAGRFSTGLDPLDDVIGGVNPGETLFITAYSGLYKSALLQNILLNACGKTAQHHLFFSLEMPATRVFQRTIQIGLGRYTYNIESEWHHHDQEKRAATMLQLNGINANKLLVCETPGLSLEKIEHYTRQAKSKYGQIGAIGIDYLGLMDAPGTRGEYERISKVAEDSKQLAKRLNIPVIVLTQISRAAVTSGDIDMHSAKGSGAIEASADYMVGMKREKNGTITLKLLKNRNGEAGAAWECDIKKDFLQFRSLTPIDELTRNNVQRGDDRKAKQGTTWAGGEDPY